MRKSILIIDDDKNQSIGLKDALSAELHGAEVFEAHDEDAIKNYIYNKFYSLAIVDLRMDSFSFDGIDIIKQIIEVNPFSKIIITSAFTQEYLVAINPLLSTGKILAIEEKQEFKKWIPLLVDAINVYYDSIENDSTILSDALLANYAAVKNEPDTYAKGVKFENFVSLLFNSIGYNKISKRVIDKSRNEVDIMIRNEIDDSFLNKFGKYILIECKNKPESGISKNDFIVFNNKIRHTNGLSELGVIITTGYIAHTTYTEAIRESGGNIKIIFLSNPQIERLLKANSDILNEFKAIVDEQVKDSK